MHLIGGAIPRGRVSFERGKVASLGMSVHESDGESILNGKFRKGFRQNRGSLTSVTGRCVSVLSKKREVRRSSTSGFGMGDLVLGNRGSEVQCGGGFILVVKKKMCLGCGLGIHQGSLPNGIVFFTTLIIAGQVGATSSGGLGKSGGREGRGGFLYRGRLQSHALCTSPHG